jgi:hypothetical protein
MNESRELASLRAEIETIKNDRRREIEERHDERISSRTLPPMAQMTRIQKRYVLEPWMTTLSVGFGSFAVLGFVAGMFTPWHVEFSMLGLLFTVVAAICVVTKLNFMEWNSKTESQITANRQNYDYDYDGR